jgi:tripartite-type tricarboxylate transporter receptor subunit TctC
MRRRDFLEFCATSVALSTSVGRASAQSLSNQPIRLVVPFPPGGATDIVARPLARILDGAAEITIIVVNHGGAGGSLGAEDVAHAAPDGRTLLMGTVGTQAINASLYKHLPYDPIRDFTPIALVATAPVTIVVHPSLAVHNVSDLVSLAKHLPGKLNYGTGGAGTPGHLTAEMFKAVTGIEIQHVPYKGGGPAITDLLAGNIQIMFEPLQSLLPHIKAEKIRAIAVSSNVRSPAIPDVPTIAESGYPGFEAVAWWGIFGPANLPSAIVDALAEDIRKAVASAPFRNTLEPLGVSPMFRDRIALTAFEMSEVIKWGKAVRSSGASVD